MYNKQRPAKTTLHVNQSYQGERIEEKIQRIVNNKEPITDGAPLIYTERKHGVQPAYDIRTDRFEIAVEAMDRVTKTQLAKRDNFGKTAKENMDKEKETEKPSGTGDPLQSTDNQK